MTVPRSARVSIVIPCRDEAESIEQLLDALRRQDRLPDEVVIVDDGSTDAIRAVLDGYAQRHPELPLHVVSASNNGIPAAVNTGVRFATGDVIIRLDAHSCPADDYVRRSVETLVRHGAGVSGGAWEIAAGAPTLTARAIARAVAHPMGAGDAAYRIARGSADARDVDTVPFGCFSKGLWQELGGFNEQLLTNEDYEFNYRVRRRGRRVVFDPSIHSTYFSRATIGALATQYFRYGWWKAQMLKANPASVRWRQALPAVFVGGCYFLLGLSAVWRPAAWLLAGVAAVYLAALLAASARICRGHRTRAILPILPVVFATIHFAWGTGVLVNVLTLGRWPARPRPRVVEQGVEHGHT